MYLSFRYDHCLIDLEPTLPTAAYNRMRGCIESLKSGLERECGGIEVEIEFTLGPILGQECPDSVVRVWLTSEEQQRINPETLHNELLPHIGAGSFGCNSYFVYALPDPIHQFSQPAMA